MAPKWAHKVVQAGKLLTPEKEEEMVPGEEVPQVCFGLCPLHPARLKLQSPRLSMALAPRLARQACLWVTAHWGTHRAHPHCRGSCSTSEVGCGLRLPHSASSGKTHQEVSVVWLACRFTDILYRKTRTFWCNWNVGCFCNRMSRCRNRWILLTMGHWQCSTTAAPKVSAHLKRSSLAKPCRIFATVGFVLHTGTFCHSTLKNKTKQGQ